MSDYSHATKIRVITESIGNDFLKLLDEYPEDDRWDWGYVSRNPLVTLEYITDHPDLQWDFFWLSQNPNITIDFVREYRDEEWDWQALSSNEGITIQDIRENPDLPWDWVLGGVSRNPSVTLADVRAYPETFVSTNVFYSVKLSELTEEEIYKYAHFLCANKNLTWQDIISRPNCPWRWEWISSLPCVTLDIVRSNPDKPWNWYSLSGNPSISLETIKSNPQLPWKPVRVSERSDLTWEFVRENPNIMQWDYNCMAMNPNFTWDIISNNPNLFTDMEFISMNPSLTYDIIKNNQHWEWDWDALVNNVFVYDDQIFKVKGEAVLKEERDAIDDKHREAFRTIWCSGKGKINIPDVSVQIEKFITMF